MVTSPNANFLHFYRFLKPLSFFQCHFFNVVTALTNHHYLPSHPIFTLLPSFLIFLISFSPQPLNFTSIKRHHPRIRPLILAPLKNYPLQKQMRTAEKVYLAYSALFESPIDDHKALGTDAYPLPLFAQEDVISLCDDALAGMSELPSLLRLSGKMHIIGDLHGNIRDLLRILNIVGSPPQHTFLFLGDYIDRGAFSVEVFTLLLALCVKYPRHCYLLRGNHEFRSVCEQYGFKKEVVSLYRSRKVFEKFVAVMEALPIAALINDNIFCVHGGISPLLKRVEDIDEIDRPPEETRLLEDLMWSDPSTSTPMFTQSTRGQGCFFGANAVKQFIKDNNLRYIVRGHQFTEKGVEQLFDGSLVTVFSASNYKSEGSNNCGLVKVNADGEIEAFYLPPLPTLKRDDAAFARKAAGQIPVIKSMHAFTQFERMKLNGTNSGLKFITSAGSSVTITDKKVETARFKKAVPRRGVAILLSPRRDSE